MGRHVSLGLLLSVILSCRHAPPVTQPARMSAGGGEAPPAGADELEARIRARLDSVQAQSTFYAKDLATGREIAIRADQPMNTASVIKIPVMILAYRDADAGRLDLDARYVIRPEDVRRGSGLLQTFAVGLQPTLRDLVTQMIITSDNTATDIMVGKVGLDRVNRLLDSLGFRETRLQMTVAQAFRGVWVQVDPKYASMSDREVFQKGFPPDPDAAAHAMAYTADPTKWLGRTTAREISRMLERLQRGELASRASTDEMLRVLREQLYASRIPQRIRFRAQIGHKTGDWPPIIGNDVGLIYVPSGQIVIAVFTNQNRGDFFDLEAAEGRVAEDVVNAWGHR